MKTPEQETEYQQKITDQVIKGHLDITAAETVEVVYDKRANVLWVNINGVCALRACRIERFFGNVEK